MKSTIQIYDDAAAGRCRIEIEGTIGVPEAAQFHGSGGRVATYDGFRQTLARIGAVDAAEVEVHIRSTGGDVNDALLIYEALRSLPGRVVTRCYGYTASAATVIAQAASPGGRQIASSALYLIHNSICATEGNASELASRTELLQQTDARLAALYAARSGRPADEFAALMAENGGNGRWLSPEQTVAAGLADEVTDLPGTERVRNDAGGWRGLLARLGWGRTASPQPAAARNILHAATLPQAAKPSPDRDTLHLDGATPYEEGDHGIGDASRPGGELLQSLGAESSLGAGGADASEAAGALVAAPGQGDSAVQRSAIAFEEGQRAAQPTRTQPTEDPSPYEVVRSANGTAYDADARNLRRR